MAEFCKITADGQAMNAPNPLRIVIANPSDERYRYEGWLEKQYTEPPVYEPETQYLSQFWTRDGSRAVQHWTVCEAEAESVGTAN